MRNTTISLPVFMLLCAVSSFSLGNPPFEKDTLITLEIEIIGKELERGALMVAVFDNPSDFLTERSALSKKVTYVAGTNLSVQLPSGKYAVAVYHDINANEKLDQNLFRYPTEPYGFSNNPGQSLGPPSYEKAAFMLDRDMRISISLN